MKQLTTIFLLLIANLVLLRCLHVARERALQAQWQASQALDLASNSIATLTFATNVQEITQARLDCCLKERRLLDAKLFEYGVIIAFIHPSPTNVVPLQFTFERDTNFNFGPTNLWRPAPWIEGERTNSPRKLGKHGA